jgi:zinc transporter 7
MLCFASGGLLGDVFIHALPHLLLSESTVFGADSHIRSIIIGALVLSGFFLFFMVEKVMNVCSSQHSNTNTTSSESVKRKSRSRSKGRKVASPQKVNMPHPHSHEAKLSTTGILNILADVMHNFTDGIAIGAAFSGGRKLAFARTISILFHEIPHELGDFSILLESGFTKFEAIKTQMVTALSAVLGTILGLFAQRSPFLEEILSSITCGGFLYVSTLGVLSMLSGKKGTGYTQISLESMGFLLGVFLMIFVAFMEECSEEDHISGHSNTVHQSHNHNHNHDHDHGLHHSHDEH